MNKGLRGWIAAFKAGKHPGKGKLAEHTFSRADLDEMVANLSQANPIPHVITHESLFSPFAYGHAIEAKREDDTLYIRSEKINPDFEKLVKSGALFERSVRIIKGAKGWALDHIAWLGAEPPAVEGLAPVEFSKADGFADFQFIDTQTPFSLKRLARQLRTFIVDKFDTETADNVIPEYEIDNLQYGADQATAAQDDQHKDSKSTGDQPVHFSKTTKEPKGGDPVELTQADLDKAAADAKAEVTAEFQAKLDEQSAEFDAQRQKHLQAEWQDTVDAAIGDGRLTPAQAEGLAEFACALPADADAVVEFSRDNGKDKKPTEVKTPMGEWLGDFVASLPVQVGMAHSTKSNRAADDTQLDSTDSEAIAKQAVAYQKEQADKGLTVSVATAVAHVTKETD